jgi:hypothetical protein
MSKTAKNNTPKVIIVLLRRPKPKLKDPNETRADPFWEFGSFGCTGCHGRNIMNPKKIHSLKGARFAFAQGGNEGFKLVHLSPPINKIVSCKNSTEAKWSPKKMPFKYCQAPLLINNDGDSDFPLLIKFIKHTDRSTWVSKFSSRFRSRSKPVEIELANEIIKKFEKVTDSSKPNSFAKNYTDALPNNPPKNDHKRKQTYNSLRQKSKKC